MASIFRLDDEVRETPKRNSFDMSKQNNLTTVFGRLTPVLVQPVMPGDSVRIEPHFGLRFMPQVFPTQTRQRASVKYYYVRNRNLWKDWPDFIGKTKQGLVPPYLTFEGDDNKFLRPSSLADYMGFPIHLKRSSRGRTNLKAAQPNFVKGNRYAFIPNSSTVLSNQKGDPFSIRTLRNISVMLGTPTINNSRLIPMSWLYGGSSPAYAVDMPLYVDNSSPVGSFFRPTSYAGDMVYLSLYRRVLKPSGDVKISVYPGLLDYGVFVILRDTTGTDYLKQITASETLMNFVGNDAAYEITDGKVTETNVNIESILGFVMSNPNAGEINTYWPTIDMNVNIQLSDEVCWCDIAYDDMPFASVAHPEGLRMSALPFRAVESVYNALIRNAENNPLIINGVPEYNRYIQSDAGGAQRASQILQSYPANWADDRFTTALPSPQQGNAPLVGLTGNNVGAVFTIGNDDGTNQMIRLQVDSNTGNVIGVDAGASTANEDLTSEMWNAVDYGISIMDLRNVNSYQRWKENNIRGGYKYKDQISSHYGVNVRYDVLDMPEFIGGCSRDVDVRQVTQTVENEYGNLGDYAGQSFVEGEGKVIEQYCDEHGFIIGLLSVYPMPIYTDALPKYWLANDPFDYFFPEFGKIGPQPIQKMELAFSQSFLEDVQKDTFGYQRSWYDLLENLDEVHGLFQSDLKNFIISREFAQTPTLGSDFLTIDSEDLNNTFYVEDDSDKIIGEIYHDMSMKRPVPLRGIPAIE